MKIAVMGGSGLVESKLVTKLGGLGHGIAQDQLDSGDTDGTSA